MEFFEKAHVSKETKESARKDNKLEETVKKQLKQMLDGYKRNDNKLLKDCDHVEPIKYFDDDSSSVSGFSDLVLSNSSNEGGTPDVLALESEDTVSALKEPTRKLSKGKGSSTSSVSSIKSISEYKDSLESLSGDISQDTDESISLALSDNVSLISSLLETTTDQESPNSVMFDADGTLANMILNNLEKKGKTSKKTKKRKYNQFIEEDITPQQNLEDKTEMDPEDMRNIVDNSEEPNYEIQTDDETHAELNVNTTSESTESQPFLSITATDMSDYSFGDIFGDYKYSTVKNMPTEIQTIAHSSKNYIFSMDCISDVRIEDIDCLSPDEDELDTQHDEGETLQEDSSMNDDTLQNNQTFEKESSLESTQDFVNTIKVYYANNCCVFVMKHPAELYVHGKVNVRCLGGKINIHGYTLEDETCEIYAPHYNIAYCLNTVENQNPYHGLFSKLTSTGLSVYEAEEIVTSVGEYDGILCMSSLNSQQMDFVENNFTVTELFSRSRKNIDNSLKLASEILDCTLYSTKPSRYFEENSNWRQAVQYGLNNGSRGIVCGGKGVGKSTFLRYCVNRLLSQGPVLVIDLDPGQSEFTVAGSVSATVVTDPLLGPNFTHLKKPDKMLYLGMINTMDNPRRYSAAVCELIKYCSNNNHFQTMPWVVNTMGMCNAIGLKFISLIIMCTRPTYLLQIDSKTAKKRFPCYLNPGTVINKYVEFQNDILFRDVPYPEDLNYSFFVCNSLNGSFKKEFSLAPRDERYLNYLAYFGKLLSGHDDIALLGITPYEVNFQDLHIGINIKINGDAALKVINGKIVALCQLRREDNSAKVFALDDKPLLCFGHGLIRAVDYEKEKLFVIIPSNVDLALVNTLVYADWVPEIRGQEQHLPDGIAVPYRTTTVYQQRQLMYAPRRRFNPIQLLKMSRSPK